MTRSAGRLGGRPPSFGHVLSLKDHGRGVQPVAARAGEAPDETFQLLRRVMATIKARFRAELQAHGLTFPQWFVVKTLRREGRATVKELAAELQVTPANVTGILDRLERDGLATRSRSNEDRRVVFARLTERGHKRADEIMGAGTRVLGELFADYSREDHDTMRALLSKVRLTPDDPLDL